MRILALDTAGMGCAAALWQDGVALAHASERMERGQAEALMPMIERVMADTPWSSLDRLAVTVGPGSFTGVRIGLSAARGLALASGRPVIGITTPEAYVAACPQGDSCEGTIVVVIDARREEVFVQAFRSSDHSPLMDIAMMTPDAVWMALQPLGNGPHFLTGDGVALIATRPEWLGSRVLPSAEAIDPAVVARLAAHRAIPDKPPSALYSRAPDAVIPLNGGRLRD